MIDVVASVFRLENARYRSVPRLEFEYEERGAGVRWNIVAGGSRAYLLRYGTGLNLTTPAEFAEQNADSHFMMSRVQSALLLGGHGLYQAEAVGRIFFQSVQDQPNWFTQLDYPTSRPEEASDSVYDWLGALTRHTMLRRAAADAHAALSQPHEAGTFVYRGFEWLVVGENRKWDQLASDIGVPSSAVRDFKKLVNVNYGVRHASRSGEKLRADIDNYGTWVCALIDAINSTRARLEAGYTVADPETVARAVAVAVPVTAYV